MSKIERSRSYFLLQRIVIEMVLFIVEENNADIPESSFEPAEVDISFISGTSSTKRASNARAVFNVSSIRVPRCNLSVTDIRPLSCCCIKSVPILPVSTGIMVSAKNRNSPPKATGLWFKHHANPLAYLSSTQFNARTTVLSYHVLLAPSSTKLPSSSTCTLRGFSSWLANIGVSEIAIKVEVVVTIVTIQPNSRNMIPAIPVSVVKGTNTAIKTRVVAITDIHTSLVAYMAASRGFSPRSTCLVIFSNTTMASSTTIPIATVSEQSEMIFNDESTNFR